MIHITHIEGTLFQKISGCIGKYVSKKNNQCSLSLKNKIVPDKLICSVYYHFMRVLYKS